ncbi:GRSF1 [Cordylochernes scorpioides]|uniref:GRSF1 n=1 Tax=Cordylochernes scorpioides TaxID=51811 RepID=A0ABY6KJL4_9ARAC|nr:GRSF1 [Cordylochernes scorpioides]
MEGCFIAQIRGLPWGTKEEEVLRFFEGCIIVGGEEGVHLETYMDKPTGKGFVEFENEEELNKGVSRHKNYLGKRYIEVFRSTREDMILRIPIETCVRVRGLPFHSTENDVVEWKVKNGIGFIDFMNLKGVEAALKLHKEKMGQRYIEVFKCTREDFRRERFPTYAMQPFQGPMQARPSYQPYDRPSPFQSQYDRPSQSQFFTEPEWSAPSMRNAPVHRVKMRGLPFQVQREEINQFFHPLNVRHFQMDTGPNGRLNGNGEVIFGSHEEALEAMGRNKNYIQRRYVELFLDSQLGYSARGNGGNMRYRPY